MSDAFRAEHKTGTLKTAWPSIETRLAVAENALRSIGAAIDTMRKTSTVSQSLTDQMTDVRRTVDMALAFSPPQKN